MNDEKWLELIETLETKFDIAREKEVQKSEDDLGNQILTTIEILEFESPGGIFKIERATRPMIIDKKVHYSKTAGSKGQIEYILSPTEKTHKLTAFRKDQVTDNWEEINLGEGGLKF